MFMNDADGNMLSDGRFTYHWDCENRLVAVEDKSGRVDVRDWRRFEYRYDYMGRRIHKLFFTWSKPNKDWMATPYKEVSFIYDAWNLIREDIKEHRSPTGGGGGKGKGQAGGGLPDAGEFTFSTNFYVWGLDLSGSLQGAGGIGGLLCMVPSSGGVASGRGGFFYTFDGNGNVSELISDLGPLTSVSAHYEYSPFGETIVSTGSEAFDNPFQFSTKYWDSEVALNYYGYRYYSPSLGRWLSRDPIGAWLNWDVVKMTQFNNLYAFVFNNSVRNIDFLGLDSISVSYSPGTHGSIEAYGSSGNQVGQVIAPNSTGWGSVSYWYSVQPQSVAAIVTGSTDYSARPRNSTLLQLSAFVRGSVKVSGCCTSKKLIVDWTVEVDANPENDVTIGGKVGTTNSRQTNDGWFELDFSNGSASFFLEAYALWYHTASSPEGHSGSSHASVAVSCK